MIHLEAVALNQLPADAAARFPFTVPVVRAMRTLTLSSSVTFFVGENGSGKSTLLEAIGAAAGSVAVGSDGVESDATLAAQRRLGSCLRLTWTRRTRRGFFLRAEDFFGFTKRIAQLRAEMLQEVEDTKAQYEAEGRSAYALGLALGPLRSSVRELEARYGIDLDANSHGQSFLKLFQARFVPGGLYLLDEPEAPLSPQSQLALIAMLMEMVDQEAQFIIATHSPMLLAFPGATIYDFDRVPAEAVAYEDLAHVTLTRDFLQQPERYLRRLREETPT